ncbi:transporter substrate-binding domain-containing protein [Cytobacillus purgationiresistens]|uniref:histidine kinase n=1 Tax=Cytobacillus purgationiresistens TaxID=863449 RepID=A0ABU0AN23_9BACI|nr:transporter substrate-binding domain-containing protein [Cytobacillus purgationiresistens]MDQ0271788.1 polar amino acid transport system substrate-binding protein [Cytobacillus purgationiresistens]
MKRDYLSLSKYLEFSLGKGGEVILKYFTLIWMVYACSFLFVSTTFAEVNVYKVAGELAFPPFSYMNQEEELTGISIELMERIAEETGMEFEFIPMDLRDAEEALKRGEIDAIAGMTYSVDKDRDFDFSTPYFTMSDSLVIPKDQARKIGGIEDLRGSHIVLQDQTTGLNTLMNLRNTNFTLVANQYNGLLMLLNKRADVFVGNKWTSAFFLNKYHLENQYVIHDIVLDPADYAIAVKEGNESLRSILDKTITDLKAKGEITHLIEKRVKPGNEAEIARLEHFITLLFIFLCIGAFVLIIIYLWNKRLKAAVDEQTKDLILLNADLRQQRQRTADSNAFKDQILNNIDTGIVTFDLHFSITSCNSRALNILELSSVSAYNLQQSPIFMKIVQDDNFKSDEEDIFRFLDITHQGKRKIIYYSLNKMYNSLENQAGYLLTMNDETEKKKLEQKLITQEKLRALGQLVAGVAHEIRNPLTSIKTFVDLIPRKYNQPAFQEMLMKHLPAEVDRLGGIVTDLIDYARPGQPNIQPCSAEELTSLLTFLQVTMNENNINFEEELGENLVFYIDPQQLRQVLLNLLFNAIHAVEQEEDKKIRMVMEKESDCSAKIQIIDNGQGMNQEELNHIFDPFYTTKDKGVGLGLTLSYNLVKENGGDIFVSSIPLKGTTFTIVLPIYQEEETRNEIQNSSH